MHCDDYPIRMSFSALDMSVLRQERQIAVDEDVVMSIARGLRHHVSTCTTCLPRKIRPYIVLASSQALPDPLPNKK